MVKFFRYLMCSLTFTAIAGCQTLVLMADGETELFPVGEFNFIDGNPVNDYIVGDHQTNDPALVINGDGAFAIANRIQTQIEINESCDDNATPPDSTCNGGLRNVVFSGLEQDRAMTVFHSRRSNSFAGANVKWTMKFPNESASVPIFGGRTLALLDGGGQSFSIEAGAYRDDRDDNDTSGVPALPPATQLLSGSAQNDGQCIELLISGIGMDPVRVSVDRSAPIKFHYNIVAFEDTRFSLRVEGVGAMVAPEPRTQACTSSNEVNTATVRGSLPLITPNRIHIFENSDSGFYRLGVSGGSPDFLDSQILDYSSISEVDANAIVSVARALRNQTVIDDVTIDMIAPR